MDTIKCAAGRIWGWVKRDPVLFAALLAAVVSAFFVPPSLKYIDYIDLRVLSLLLSLMLVVAGLQEAGVFGFLIDALLRRVHSTRTLGAVLVGTCFFASMLITNDVALITFVPLTVMILSATGSMRLLIPIIVLQTVAANLGSMLTPLGNPQNLYLYSLSEMSAGEFIATMAPATGAALVLLVAALLFIKAKPLTPPEESTKTGLVWPWLLLFVLCLLSVLRIVPYYVTLAVVVAVVLVLNRGLLKSADWGLLLTFVFLFVFIGNLSSIPAVSGAARPLVKGREVEAGILLSQIISNVPAAMLLSGFTTEYSALLIGVNLGGLGTLIASMASLISYKQYAAVKGAKKGLYLGVFTLVNVAFLAVLWSFTALIGQ